MFCILFYVRNLTMAGASEVSKINIGLYLHKCLWEDFLPIHYLFKGKIAHIVTGSLTIYSVVHFSLGIILQTVQPYHHYSTCQITDREHDLKKKKLQLCLAQGTVSICFCIWLLILINTSERFLQRGIVFVYRLESNLMMHQHKYVENGLFTMKLWPQLF